MTAGRKIISQSVHWCTPVKYVNAVKRVFKGSISLDPCSNIWSIVKAETEYIYPEKDGLKETWNYPTIYVNPPYGTNQLNGTSIKNWLYRCLKAYETFGSEVIALIPVATNTGHWKNYIWGKASAICFLYDTRLKFLVQGVDGGKGAPMACAMIYWNGNIDVFQEVFLPHGAVVDVRGLKGVEIGSIKKEQLSLFDNI